MGLGYGTEWSFGAWLQDHNFHMTHVSSLPLYGRTNAVRKQENGETMFKLNFIRKLALMGANVTRKRSGSGTGEVVSVTAELDQTEGTRAVSVTRHIERVPGVEPDSKSDG